MSTEKPVGPKKAMFDEEKPPSAAVVASMPGDRVADILKALADATPDERHQLERQLGGVKIPARPRGNPNAVVWAYRCTHCEKWGHAGQYALEFQGDIFLSATGKALRGPSPDVPFEDLPWTQTNGKHQTYDRNAPHCQHCGNLVQTSGGGEPGKAYIFGRAMVHIEQDKERIKKMHSALAEWRKNKGKVVRPADYSLATLEQEAAS